MRPGGREEEVRRGSRSRKEQTRQGSRCSSEGGDEVRICASRVPAGGWEILLDPSLRFNTYLIFNNYLIYKTFILFYLHLQPQAITRIGGGGGQ